MTYNVTNLTNADSYYQIFVAVNQLGHDWIASFLIFAVFLIIIMMFSGRYELDLILIADSFICAFLSFLFMWLNLMGYLPLLIFMIIMFVSLVYNKFTQ